MLQNINKLKAAVAAVSGPYDEGTANAVLFELRETIVEALGGSLEMVQARVLCDKGDAFQYLVLDLPDGTTPGEAYNTLMREYYESGEFGPDSYIISVRGITQDGKFWEVPFGGDTPLQSVGYWLNTKVDNGSTVSGPDDVWTKRSMKIISSML